MERVSTQRGGARELWKCAEPFHAVTYFTGQARAAFEEIGLRGFWRGYFAGRAAPLGAVGPGVVVATFYGFRPDFVARAVPEVWDRAHPGVVIEARLRGAGQSLAVAIDVRASQIARAAELVARAVDGCDPFGRPLFAANADLPWPAAPYLALWQGCTLLREHRGDGHVVALQSAGIDPCESHVLRIAVSGVDRSTIAPNRGWDDADWDAATARLVERGWLHDSGAPTTSGIDAHRAVEAETDRLARGAVAQLGGARLDELLGILRPLARALEAAGTIPYPNAIGVPRPGTE
jgi:hypothetical protein